MKIGIDAHFLSKISQGTGTYSYQLINGLIKTVNGDSLYLLNKEDIVANHFSNIPHVNWGHLYSNFTPYNIILGFNKAVKDYSLDILHTNYLTSIYKTRAKKIITVHDILFKSHSHFFPRKLSLGVNIFTTRSFKQADHIIAVSNYTKEQLIKYYPFTQDKITVIYEAASPDYFQLDTKTVKETLYANYYLEKPYILFVGRLAPIKNIESLIDFYTKTSLSKDFDLVIVGKYDISFPNTKLEKIIENTNSIHHLSNIENTTLNYLYNGASLLYFVSQGEGFGLPILEAMSAGCPVITSNTTACNEIAGDAALKADPNNKDEIFNRLDFFLRNESKREEYKEKGLKHVKEFSWKKCTLETLELYKS
ncbi:glycosyltransferase family 1 protein [Dysgonomonas sp. 521]|uniref:glycosyltransferase family 4 protein n=1 Tax=Dysgonomonas sp. 521 TaxID=2302932 RepID=UPI0013D2AF3C|nr:glycosyltransferase family 1 protein [Dysgonomonas sp. 521]NDV96114.1 glycosyltransferase family 1 protein [Dysgonomonas sp. 521]